MLRPYQGVAAGESGQRGSTEEDASRRRPCGTLLLPPQDGRPGGREEGAALRWLKPVADSWPVRFVSGCLGRYFRHDVGRQSAALAYYLLFTLFPFLIFLSSLLGLLHLDVSEVLRALRPLLPTEVLAVAESYLAYAARTSSAAMLWFGLIFSIYFPMRAADCLMRAVRRAYHLPRPTNHLVYRFKVLFYTVFLLVTIALTLALATVSQRMLAFAGRYITLPSAFVELWDLLRFPLLAVVVFGAVGLLYAMAQDTRQPGRNVVPGVVASLTAWMALSAAYSFYVANFANYSLIYGTLGTVVVLMIWLYLTATVLIMGAEINDTLMSLRGRSRRRDRNSDRETS